MRLRWFMAVVVAVMSVAAPVSARKVRVGPRRIVVERTAGAEAAAPFDTIACPSGAIRCSGYDKPNRASKETFFVTNLSVDSLAVEGLIITLDYSDMQGRQLHRARRLVKVSLPPGQTRAVSVPTWDVNNAFHYFRTPAPARRQSTPYRVSAAVDSLLLAPM